MKEAASIQQGEELKALSEMRNVLDFFVYLHYEAHICGLV